MFCRILHCFFAKTGLSWFTRFWQISWMAIDSALCWWGSVRLRHEMRHAGGSNHFKACWASKCHQASTHGLFFDSETYLWSLNEVMTYNISWSWLSQYCWRMRKATRPWSQSLASLDRSFQRRTFTYFHFFFNFTFFQRRTFTYFHQLLHFWYHHHCFHWPIQIYSFQRWQKWSDENALFANLIIETNY